ncbi:MAG TPA: metalloregulator ArsR/SmtB family transcription factor [Kofleriaceae bacterium]|nr:metalloregulator ArsR/SmtB family transcription factor [Kofleriaceae bacterium]
MFAALGDPTRIALIEHLFRKGPASVTALSARATVTRQAITKHLRVLEDAGLVKHRRVGRETIFELSPARVAAAQRALDAISREWDERLGRLRHMVES